MQQWEIYFSLWIVIKGRWKKTGLNCTIRQSDVCHYSPGHVALLLKCLWWFCIANRRKCPLSTWVSWLSWVDLVRISFPGYLLPCFFTSSYNSGPWTLAEDTLCFPASGPLLHWLHLPALVSSQADFHSPISGLQKQCGTVERAKPWNHANQKLIPHSATCFLDLLYNPEAEFLHPSEGGLIRLVEELDAHNVFSTNLLLSSISFRLLHSQCLQPIWHCVIVFMFMII